MRKRTRMFIVVLVLAAVAFMLLPTVQWYFFWDETKRDQASFTTQAIKNEAMNFAEDGFIVFNAQFEEDPSAVMNLDPAGETSPVEGISDTVRSDAFNAIRDEVARIYKEGGKKLPGEITYDLAKGAFVASDKNKSVNDLEQIVEKNIRDFLESYKRAYLFEIKDQSEKIIQLGLDLAGGVSYTLEADIEGYAAEQNRINYQDAYEAAVAKIVEEEGVSEEEARERDAETLDLKYDEFNLSSATAVDQIMEIALQQVTERVNIYGASEPEIQRLGDNWIQVDLPGAKDPERLKRLLMGRGSLNFHVVDTDQTDALYEWRDNNRTNPAYLAALDNFKDGGTLELPAEAGIKPGYMVVGQYEKDAYREDRRSGWQVVKVEPGMAGRRVEGATITSLDETGAVGTSFRINSEGQQEFGDLTKGASEETPVTIAVLMDGKSKMTAGAREQLLTANLQVSGRGIDRAEAEDFAKLLNLGSKEVGVEILSSDVIGSGLGADYVEKGINALFWAMILVVGFMLVWYLGGGLAANVALVLNIFIMAGILSQIQLTLTLAGMAGLILTVGMSVDANVIIFERIKEEARLGKSAASALRAGFQKAFWTILDANITTFIAAVVLAYFGSGTVKGFAMILAVGIFSSMFTSLFAARLFLDIGVESFKVKRLLISWRK